MGDTNIKCEHKPFLNKDESIDFCGRCGCILVVKQVNSLKEIESFSVHHKKVIFPPEVSPQNTFAIFYNYIESAFQHDRFSKLSEEYFDLRKTLIELLKDYIIKYQYSVRSLYLGVHMLDTIFSSYPFSDLHCNLNSEKLVLGVFLVAVKFLEDDAYPPNLNLYVNKQNPSILYPLNEVRRYESLVLQLMNYNLRAFTSHYILETLLSHGIIFTHELNRMGTTNEDSMAEILTNVSKLSQSLNLKFLEDKDSLKFTPIQIALSCIAAAKELLKFATKSSPEMEKLCKIDSDSVVECKKSILR